MFGTHVGFRVQGWLHVRPVLTVLPRFLTQPSVGAAQAVGRTTLPSLLMVDLQLDGAQASCCPKPVPSLQQCPSPSHVVHLRAFAPCIYPIMPSPFLCLWHLVVGDPFFSLCATNNTHSVPNTCLSLPALPLHLSCCCPACVSLYVQHVGDHQHSNAAAGKDPRGCEAALCAAGPLTPSLCDCSRPDAQEATRVPVASKGGCSERETEWGRYDVELLATQRQFRKDLV